MIDVNHNRARQKEPNESCRQRLEEPIPFNPVSAGGLNKLPYGNLPRLLLAWVCSEAVRTQRRELVLWRSLYEFMRKLGMDDRSGSAENNYRSLTDKCREEFQVRQQVLEGLKSERRTLLSLAVIAGAVGALGARLTTEAARWLWDTSLAILSVGWTALAAWWNSL